MTDKILTWIKENKWLAAGVIIAVLNPVPSGVILGIVMLTEEKLKKTGQIVLGICAIVIIVTFVIFFLVPRR